jgi:hypothetical protein
MQKTQDKRKNVFPWFRWKGRRKVQRQVKDRLFRFIFEKDKEALLQLYNALNGTAYQDAEQLEVVTIENAVYVVMKNDLAFMIAGTLNLYEHQSTYNPNMPVRFLIYLAEEYQKIVELDENSLYGKQKIMLPTPQCVVLYNGGEEMPEESILRLSDAFGHKKEQSDVEVRVRMLNINYGHNQRIMDQCEILAEYAEFISISRQYAAEGKNMQDAMNAAVEYCIDHGILSRFLRQNRAEVLGMLLEEFDVEKYERTLRSEGREDGFRDGLREGRAYGFRDGYEEAVRKMLLKGMTVEQVAEILELSIESVEIVKADK